MALPFGPDDEPLVNPADKYAVAATKGDGLILAQSFGTLEELAGGFEEWRNMSTAESIETLRPVEIIAPGKYKVLTSILDKYK